MQAPDHKSTPIARASRQNDVRTCETTPLEVECPHCKKSFPLSKMEGHYLDRRCPHCHEQVSSELFDMLARDIIEHRDKIRAAKSATETRIDRLKQMNEKLQHPFWKPLSCFLNGRRNRLIKTIKPERKHIARLNDELREIAFARYHVSEWYQRTHIPLISPEQDSYKFKPKYKKHGIWTMTGTGPRWRGILAESQVFEALMLAVNDEDSPLFQAHILPCLFLPHTRRQNKKARLYDQIDCLVLTKQAAFVLEVKARATHVVSFSPFHSVFSTQDAGALYKASECIPEMAKFYLPAEGFETELSSGLSQNRSHVSSLITKVKAYDARRVYEQLVIVDALSLTSDTTEFVDERNVSYLKGEDRAFVRAIERECTRLNDIMTQQQLDDLGRKLMTAYGDLNQKHEAEHIERIHALQLAREAEEAKARRRTA